MDFCMVSVHLNVHMCEYVWPYKKACRRPCIMEWLIATYVHSPIAWLFRLTIQSKLYQFAALICAPFHSTRPKCGWRNPNSEWHKDWMNTGGAQSTRGYNHNCLLAPGTRYPTSFPGGLTTGFCLSAICDIIPTSRIWLHAVQQRWSSSWKKANSS